MSDIRNILLAVSLENLKILARENGLMATGNKTMLVDKLLSDQQLGGSLLRTLPVDVLIDQYNAFQLLQIIEADPKVYTEKDQAGKEKIRDYIVSSYKDLRDWLAKYGRIYTLEELVNLTDLDIAYKGITSIPESIENLGNLQKLNLNFSNFKIIPENIDQLSNLQEIWLGNNPNLTQIPASIGNLQQLRRLYLHGNQNLTSIPESLGKLSNLQWLRLHQNPNLTSIPESLGDLTALESLELYRNTALTRIPESIANLQRLKDLNLKHTPNIPIENKQKICEKLKPRGTWCVL